MKILSFYEGNIFPIVPINFGKMWKNPDFFTMKTARFLDF